MLLLTSTDSPRGSGVQNCIKVVNIFVRFNKLASKWDCFETDVLFCGEHQLFCFATLITSWQVVLFSSSCLVTTFVFFCYTDAVALPGWSRGEPCDMLRASSPVRVWLRHLIDWVIDWLFAAQIIYSGKLFFPNKTGKKQRHIQEDWFNVGGTSRLICCLFEPCTIFSTKIMEAVQQSLVASSNEKLLFLQKSGQC